MLENITDLVYNGLKRIIFHSEKMVADSTISNAQIFDVNKYSRFMESLSFYRVSTNNVTAVIT